ncbi:MAG: alfa-L-rhamnosidase, partial [Rubripirellula sp.]
MHRRQPSAYLCLLSILICGVFQAAFAADLQPHSLSVGENFVDPVGFYDPSPVFSWKLPLAEDVKAQTAYQIVVRDRLAMNGNADPIWDSGKVDSDQSVWVAYQGPAFESRQQVSWRVKFWDDQGRESDWSEAASIEMGLLHHDAWDANWIELDRGKRQPDQVKIFKAEFGVRTADGSKINDVIENIRGAIKRGATPIRVVPPRLGGDPAPDEAKTLWVDYEVNGVRKQVELAENRAFDPYPEITAHPAYYLRREFDAPGKIVKARL